MITTQVRLISGESGEVFAWRTLRQFHNLNYTLKKIENVHNIERRQRANAKKQANQIRQCLLQAEEYFKAASSVGMATRPVLLYYGTLSLALAEVLFKQSGNSSLDRARGAHAHHGLDFRISSDPSKRLTLQESAASLRAVPYIKGGERVGTFELWHRTSRHASICGLRENIRIGGKQSEPGVIATADDSPLRSLRKEGISLLNCFRAIPALSASLGENAIIPSTSRATFSSKTDEQREQQDLIVILHPNLEESLSLLCKGFLFSPSEVENVDITEMPSGYIVRLRQRLDAPRYRCQFPDGVQSTSKLVYLFLEDAGLNEMGYMYVALFILSNYARYYPDMWISEIDGNTSIYLTCIEFLEHCRKRIPLLTASQLQQVSYLYE